MSSSITQFVPTSTFAGREPKSLLPSNLLHDIVSWFASRKHSRQDSEIASFINEHGGVMTDDLERQISRRFGSMAG